ncbi:MAG: translation initiation factor IF-2 [Bacteroidales bacterium]|nr:translation initiation factor IF-2 [Bacteroidales bacterium]MCL2133362.1 translation initiation factor IF-2 [Bacteroidales bacterium]
MSETIRISKVVKEFNIAVNTLVEFLKKKGFEVEASPNAKITTEEYNLALKEFGKELTLKEESKKVSLKVKEKQETISIDDLKEKKKEEDEEKEIFIKTTLVERPTIKSVEKPETEKKKKETEPVETPKEKPAQSQPKEDKEEKPVTDVETVPEEAPKKEQKQTKKPEEEVVGVKIVDKIDLDSLNTKTRPDKKSKKDKKKQKEKPKPKKQQEAPKQGKPATAKKDLVVGKTEASEPVEPTTEPPKVIEHIATRIEKLSGPKIVEGQKIDLAQFEKKKPQPESRAERNKKKRERIKKDAKQRVDVQHEKQKQQSDKGGKKKDKGRFKPIHKEVDEDAVQRQIKETYARMTEGKGKTKSSKYRREKRDLVSQRLSEEQEMHEQQSSILQLTEFVTVNELANMMDVPVIKVIEACMNLGLMVSINQRLDAEALVVVAEEFGFTVEFVTADIQDAIPADADAPEDLQYRPPIITVMGHVDHGKTSLLDYIRKSNVIAGEAGGITQHIGAYSVELSDDRRITFLDTPGHEAFTAMRARGAKITDVAIIIIAADDAVMPQTIEAINHAVAANVPMVFAISKIDKNSANPEKIREQLANMNYLVEDWGGKYQCQEVDAKHGTNIDKLLEKVLLEAEMLELKANPDRNAMGSVIESSLDKGRGYVATILVQNGTLHIGDLLLSGNHFGKVKAMFNERGQRITEAGPSTPVLVLGLNGAPAAGETFNVMDDEKEAKEIANKREQLLRMQGIKAKKHITLEEIGRRIAIGNFKELNVIVKGDVDGSIEALADSLLKLSTEEVHVNVIHKAVGAISESDVLLAAASNAIIIGFQVRPSANARRLAEQEEIEIRLYSIIYDAINEVRDGIEGMLAPVQKEEITSTVEVRETFKITKVGTVAGCMVKEGKITRHAKIRVIRDGIVVYTGSLGSLKRFKDDVKEVSNGYDCGLNIDNFNDIKVGDIIEAYEIVEIKRKL